MRNRRSRIKPSEADLFPRFEPYCPRCLSSCSVKRSLIESSIAGAPSTTEKPVKQSRSRLEGLEVTQNRFGVTPVGTMEGRRQAVRNWNTRDEAVEICKHTWLVSVVASVMCGTYLREQYPDGRHVEALLLSQPYDVIKWTCLNLGSFRFGAVSIWAPFIFRTLSIYILPMYNAISGAQNTSLLTLGPFR